MTEKGKEKEEEKEIFTFSLYISRNYISN